ncbi:hypothetical protein T10_1447 [Trichinella papuae]|uniref:Uncharacterized protein n=1 Tax=Trichinella papuae TaxID=268474 RepID=A0A0V1M888_9BILA|nr:hypothetical protein T10_1447 [Trichinella papuae]
MSTFLITSASRRDKIHQFHYCCQAIMNEVSTVIYNFNKNTILFLELTPYCNVRYKAALKSMDKRQNAQLSFHTIGVRFALHT